jgi:hypothetical protein
MSTRKITPSSEFEGPVPRPFICQARRSEIVSNLAERAARTPPVTRPEEIAGLPATHEPANGSENAAAQSERTEGEDIP